MSAALDAFLRHLADRRSPRTVQMYGAVLVSFEAARAEVDVATPPTPAEIERFLGKPRRGGGRRAPSTRNIALAALRAFGTFAVRDLGWTRSPFADVPFLREPPREPAFLTAPELRRLFAVAAETSQPADRARNLAILAVLLHGLRVHELVVLNVNQVDVAGANLVAIRGKGGSVLSIPVNTAALSLLQAWLADRPDIAEPGETALFVSTTGARISIRSVQRLLLRLRHAMGTAKKLSPHALRHSAATLALSEGSDVQAVSALLRHADIRVTARYLHLVDERQRDAVRRLGIAIPADLISAPSEGGSRSVRRDDDNLDAQEELRAA